MQYKWIALSVTTVGTLMAGIDTRIVVVGIPTIAQQLHADVESVIWVSQAYLLASTIGLLLIGRVTDLIGRVKIYNYGFVIFTVGSTLASVSFSPWQLIFARLVQGTGSSMLITNSSAILTDATPKAELGSILGLNQIAYRFGSITGLTLSGVIIALADWRALFYINIPVGIFGTLWAHYRLREIAKRDVGKKMDWSGFFSFTSGLTLILLSITFLSYGVGGLALGIAFAVGGAALILLFVSLESGVGKTSPLLDLRLLKIKEFAGGSVAQMLNALAWSGFVLMISFYFQIVLGDSPLQAGLKLLPIDATYIIFGPLSGRLSDMYGARRFAVMGLAITGVGFFLLSLIGANTSYVLIAAALALLGVGNGMFVSPNISSIMKSVPPNRRGIASGFRITLLNVGITASSGLAILFITVAIPYGLFNSLLSGSILNESTLALAKSEFLDGYRIAGLVLAAINAVAIIPSILSSNVAKIPEQEESLDAS